MIERIVVHHSKSPDSDVAFNWSGLRRYHVEEKGWSDVGYHYGIEKVNGRYEVLVGRLMNRVGAHCVGLNRKSIGVCVVGDFDSREPTRAQYELLADFIGSLVEVFGLSVEQVIGHGEYDPTYPSGEPRTCPGKKFSMNKLRNAIRRHLAVIREDSTSFMKEIL